MDAARSSRLRTLAYLEGASFLLLVLGAMPLKYWAGWPLGVRVVGMTHGLLFLTYGYSIFGAVQESHWTLRTGLIAFAASLVPFGPFVFEARRQRSDPAI
jgi:integral membrane protein